MLIDFLGKLLRINVKYIEEMDTEALNRLESLTVLSEA